MNHNPICELEHGEYVKHLRSLNGSAARELKDIGDFFHNIYIQYTGTDTPNDNMIRNMAFTGMWLVNFDIAFLNIEKNARAC